MKARGTLIVHAHLFTMRGDGVGYVHDGAVAVEDNCIVEVGLSKLGARDASSDGLHSEPRNRPFVGSIEKHQSVGLAKPRPVYIGVSLDEFSQRVTRLYSLLTG